MGEYLEPVKVSFTNLETGEMQQMETHTIEFNFERETSSSNDRHFGIPVTGELKINKCNKFVLFKMLYMCDKNNEYVKKQYKYYKRCENRKLLHGKRR